TVAGKHVCGPGPRDDADHGVGCLGSYPGNVLDLLGHQFGRTGLPAQRSLGNDQTMSGRSLEQPSASLLSGIDRRLGLLLRDLVAGGIEDTPCVLACLEYSRDQHRMKG